MSAVRYVVFIIVITTWCSYASADARDLSTCEAHLNKYRRFLLQAILSFEDVCDAYNARGALNGDSSFPSQLGLFEHYQPSEQRAEVWSFIKLITGQFNDMEFASVVRDAVVEKCHMKLQQAQQMRLRRDDKRNTVVLGKKQRFHSWGGKRSSDLPAINNDLEQDHGDDMTLTY